MEEAAGGSNRHEVERFVRVEEKLNHMAEDMNEIKSTFSTLVKTLGSMHRDYVPRAELEEKFKSIATDIATVEKDMEKVDAKVTELGKRPSILTSVAFTIMSSLIVGLIIFVLTKK
jgi:tetrahydromethanopterin S-methyltransferase subunit A